MLLHTALSVELIMGEMLYSEAESTRALFLLREVGTWWAILLFCVTVRHSNFMNTIGIYHSDTRLTWPMLKGTFLGWV